MKKIILAIFLVLTAVSFSAPNFINTKAIEKAGYQILSDDPEVFVFGKPTEEAGISVAIYLGNFSGAKEVSEGVISTTPDDIKHIGSTENKRAYINKFVDKQAGGNYTYNFVSKNPKVKSKYISVLYVTDKDLSGAALDKIVEKTLNEVESYLK